MPQGLRDHFHDSACLGENVVVPEAKHLEPESCEISIATGIQHRLLNVLAAVHLDDKALFQTDKVNDVVAYGPLAAELEAVDLAQAQVSPEFALSIGRVPSERPCIRVGHAPILAFPRLLGKGLAPLDN